MSSEMVTNNQNVKNSKPMYLQMYLLHLLNNMDAIEFNFKLYSELLITTFCSFHLTECDNMTKEINRESFRQYKG